MVASGVNPLELDRVDQSIVTAAQLLVCAPYGGLDSALAQEAIGAVGSALDVQLDDATGFAAFLGSGNLWEGALALRRTCRDFDVDHRDLLGLHVVLFDTFMPQGDDVVDDYALYWRRVDTLLECLDCSFAAYEVVDALQNIAANVMEQSKSTTKSLLTNRGMLDLAETAHEVQSMFTGIYIPYAADVLRWGQDKLDAKSDTEIAGALAADVLILGQFAQAGDIERVRAYGVRLTDELRTMSLARARDAQGEKRARQISMFSTVLATVNELLGDDSDGLALDVAPALLGMRVTEARQICESQSLQLSEFDGRWDGEKGSDRTIWNAENWIVRDQAPGAGATLGRRRIIEIWVNKKNETGALHPFWQEHVRKRRETLKNSGE